MRKLPVLLPGYWWHLALPMPLTLVTWSQSWSIGASLHHHYTNTNRPIQMLHSFNCYITQTNTQSLCCLGATNSPISIFTQSIKNLKCCVRNVGHVGGTSSPNYLIITHGKFLHLLNYHNYLIEWWGEGVFIGPDIVLSWHTREEEFSHWPGWLSKVKHHSFHVRGRNKHTLTVFWTRSEHCEYLQSHKW